jgi:hypothetical protein
MVHLVEVCARVCARGKGHADLLRKAVDGDSAQ